MNNQIDCIASHHQPQDYDAKVLEFEYARYGMISLESTYGVISTAMPTLTESQKVSMLSTRARDIFRQPTPVIGVGQCAELTLFDPSIEYEFTKAHIRSRSHNSPYVGKKLQGKVMGVFSKGQWHIHD
jgi:dihydroorotase